MTLIFILLLLVALILKFFPPKKINSFYGYRTQRSKQNIKNWKIANNYSANLLIIISIFLIIVSIFFDTLALKHSKIIQSVLLVISIILMIILTENKIKN